MESINYIKHLNGVFEQFTKDSRLNPTHISLYVALFQLWNTYHFPNEFHINREEIMRSSKIGSKATYHKCIKELSHWKYLLYMPSHNPYKGSKIKMFNFETSAEQVLNQGYIKSGTSPEQVLNQGYPKSGTSTEQALVPIYKHNKQIENNKNDNKHDVPKNEKKVIEFFTKKNWPIPEAKKFYSHYQGIGWKVGGKVTIVDWQAVAQSWMLKADERKKRFRIGKTEKTRTALGQYRDNLQTSTEKNYNEPL